MATQIQHSASFHEFPEQASVPSVRLTPEVVSARRGMLQRCLKDIVAAPHVLSSHPALLQFLGAPVPESSGIATDRAELPLSQQAVANAPAALR